VEYIEQRLKDQRTKTMMSGLLEQIIFKCCESEPCKGEINSPGQRPG